MSALGEINSNNRGVFEQEKRGLVKREVKSRGRAGIYKGPGVMCLASFFKILCLSYNKSHKIIMLWLEKNNDALVWFGMRKPTCCLPPYALEVLSIVGLFIAHNLIHQLITAVGDVTLANHRAGGGALHPNASIVEDVVSIEHDPDHAKISVVLRHDARCRRPFLRGRLSGPAMVVVKDWRYQDDKKTTNNDNATFVVEATYPTPPEDGTYFLELIVVVCENILIFTPPSMIHERGKCRQ